MALSERIVDERPIAEFVTIAVGGRSLACETRGAEFASEQGIDSIEVVCERFEMTEDVSIRLNGELLTTVGTVLEVPFGDSRTELLVNPVAGGLVEDAAALLAEPTFASRLGDRR